MPSLPPLTRLVIEVVRRGSAQNLIVVRSGLTLTNHLSPNYSLEVGLQLPLESDYIGSSISSPRRPTVIPVVNVPFAQTAAVPLNLAARVSTGLPGRFCFRPVWHGDEKRTGNKAGGDVKRMLFSWSQQSRSSELGREVDFVLVPQKRSAVQPIAQDALDWLRLTKPGWFFFS